MSWDASARSCAFVTYAGLHSSAARQDDDEIALPAARWCIDGVAAEGLHPSAADHDDERIDGVPVAAGLHAALQAALDSWRRIDLVVAGSAYSASI